MTAPFKDHFSTHAADYRAFRPTYPPELFAFLAASAPARDLAWDCGTGNGQAALLLADHFARVFATDASAGQLTNAEPHPKVEYAVAPAEACPLAQLLGYLGTWSATKQFVKAHGTDPLDRFAPEFAAAWGEPTRMRTLRWAFTVRLGRVGA